MKTKKILLGLLGFAILGIGSALYMYNKPHKNYQKLKPDFVISAEQLCKEFEQNEENANAKYLDKMILVSGKISSIKKTPDGDVSISLKDDMFGITCTIDAEIALQQKAIISPLKPGDNIEIKGRCDGRLTDVRLSKCSLVN